MNSNSDNETAFEKINDQTLKWVSGELDGLYIDFRTQMVGYRETRPERLEYRKMQTLLYLLQHKDQYVTAPMLQLTAEMNSVDLPKTISVIKSSFLRVLSNIETDESPSSLFDRIISRHKVNGHMGYRLCTENTVLLTQPATSHPKEQEPVPESRRNNLLTYAGDNWFPLILLAILGIVLYLTFDSLGLSVNRILLDSVLNLYPISAILILVASVLPVIAGYWIDRPIALAEYRKSHPETELSSLPPDKLHHIVMYDAGRFDSSRKNIIYTLMANLLGALSCISLINYVRDIDQIETYIAQTIPSGVSILVLMFSVFIALFNQYGLCMIPSKERNNRNFLLSRVHSFINTLFLIYVIMTSSILTYIFISFRFVHPDAYHMKVSFLITLFTFFLFLWFSSVSPLAEGVDALPKTNFTSGIPVFTLISLTFTLLCFDASVTGFLAVASILLYFLLWLIYIKKRERGKLLTFSLSFFNIMAGCIVLLLILDLIFS